MHSQRLREKPLSPWVIANKDGRIETAHCTCMAGLGEVCSHIASVLFSVEAVVKIRQSKTVTQEKAYWLMPTTQKTIEYKEVKNINFSSAKTTKKNLDDSIANQAITPALKPITPNKSKVSEPSAQELANFYNKLSKVSSKPAILSLIDPYSSKYIPKPVTENFPRVLTEFRDESCFEMTHTELLEKCQTLIINCTDEQKSNVERETRAQAKCKLWFRFRAGRITASNMRAVCVTNQNSPSRSLIMKICYPDINKFTSKATTWGCEHEKIALDQFKSEMEKMHENVRIEDQGFLISSTYPYIGCSVDGLFVCDCCGPSTIEIKCPYCIKNDTVENHRCLRRDPVTKDRKLKTEHEYFYQVQTQLGVYGYERGYFMIWSENDIHIESITFDDELFVKMCECAKHIFSTAIMPELVGKFFSRSSVSSTLDSVSSQLDSVTSTSAKDSDGDCAASETLICYCNQGEHGQMIACDNKDCEIEWFHYTCVNIENAPRGKWFCPTCRKTMRSQRK